MFRNQARFQIAETRWVNDPFGAGVQFEIAYIGCTEYQGWVRENQNKSPLAQSMMRLMTGIAAVKLAMQKADEEQQTKAVAQFAAASDLKLDLRDRDMKGIALLIRGWESSDPNDPTSGMSESYSPKAAVELLRRNRSDPEFDADGNVTTPPRPLQIAASVRKPSDSEGLPDLEIAAATPLGMAIAEWVLWEATQHNAYRAQFLEEAEGKFAASSPGD